MTGVTRSSLTVWGQLKEAAVPVTVYWVLLVFTYATFASVLFGIEGLSTDNVAAMILIALASFPGVALGQVAAFLRVRTWIVLVFGAFCWALAFGLGLGLAAFLGEFAALVFLFFFVLPIALTGGLWSLETHRAIWSLWLPILLCSASVIAWAEAQGNDAQWYAGNKWAIWDLLTLAVLGLTVVLALLFLVSRETHRLVLWRRGPTAPLTPTLQEKGAARPRITLLGGCLLLLGAGALTIATAVVSPYLWRTGEGDRPSEQPPEQVQQQPQDPPPQGCEREPQSGPGTPPPEGADGKEMGEKVKRAVQQATGTVCTLLTLALLMLAGVLIGGPPVRRLFVVRHLREPLWPVTPTTRIEQGWRLVEIALGDAGVSVHPGEDARGLAIRAAPVLAKLSPVEVHGLDDAAEVADRVRFGLGVSRGDVEVMDRFAAWAYDTVWERLTDGQQVRCMYRPL